MEPSENTGEQTDQNTPVVIKRFLRADCSVVESCATTQELLQVAGRALDKAYSHDIVGECLFETQDGRILVGTVEFVIAEANPEYVQQILDEESEAV